MDELTERKVRDLKLKIVHVEKELAATQHHNDLGAMLRTGHPSQIAKAGERERKRLETKLDELRTKLAELDPDYHKPAAPETPKPAVKEKAAPAKAAATPKTARKTAKK